MRASSFRPAGGMRLASLITMLVVLALVIRQASQPATWAWLACEPAAARPALAKAGAERLAPPTVESIVPGPTDLNDEERGAAAEEFQALTDGATQMSREEMPAYWRLLEWTEHQSIQDLKARSATSPVLNQFIQSPDEQRGRLFRLDLNVRRVLAYDAPANTAGIEKIYEIWGWTTESKAWLYVVVTAHLPPGMPIGPDVYERATVAGYFLKVQGYHAAGAGPQDKPLLAPLLIGRVAWSQSPLTAQPREDFAWVWWLAGVAALFGVLRVGMWLWSGFPARRSVTLTPAAASANAAALRDWLSEAEEVVTTSATNAGNLRALSDLNHLNN